MSVQIIGMDKLLAKFVELGTEGVRMASAVVNVTADNIVVEAKQLAPVDLGTIRQNIGKDVTNQNNIITANIFANAPESAFQEFGTGGRVDVPEEMAEVAAQFQGIKGGSMAAFILALTEWVRRHGLTGVYSVKTHRKNSNLSNANDDVQAAWAIARAILRDGLRPRPFLYPAFVNGRAKLLPALEKAYVEMLKSA